MKLEKAPYHQDEERLNTLTHGFGFLAALLATPFLVYLAYINSTQIGVIGALVYGFCLMFSMAASTLYHGTSNPTKKAKLKKWDHISIYFLIAGTYTALILNKMYFYEAFFYLWGLWAMALIGIFFKAFYIHRFKFLSTLIYVLMGYILMLDPWMFFRAISRTSSMLMIWGGVFYTVGVVFYLWKSQKWTHAIWHVLVLLGAGSHFAALLYELSLG